MTFLSLRAKILIGFTAIFSVAFVGSHRWVQQYTTRHATQSLQAHLQDAARTIAAGVDTHELLALSRSGDRHAAGFSDDPRYRQQLDWLETARHFHPEMRLAIFMARERPDPHRDEAADGPEEIIVILDTLTPEATPDRTAHFPAAAEADPWQRQALAGLPTQREFHRDRWGEWLSAYVPLQDEMGQTVAALKADIDASEISQLRQSIRKQTAIAFCIAYGTSCLAIFLLSGILTAPLQRLQANARAVSDGHYDNPPDAIGQWFPDETTELARILAEMTRNVSEREAWMRAIFQQAGVGVLLYRTNGDLQQVNQRFCQLLGYAEPEELVGRSELSLTHPLDRVAGASWVQRCLRGELQTYSIEKRYQHRCGQTVWSTLTATLVRDRRQQAQYFIAIVADIGTRKQMEAELTQAAFYDSLTKLPNRAHFMDRLEQSQQQSPNLFAVLLVDLDDFKTINDSLGHQAGDRVLVWIGHLLDECVRSADTVARLGGDEFAILLDPIGDLQEAIAVADRVQAALRQPLQLQDREYCASASIGIALSQSPETGATYSDLAALLRDADLAMYQAKAKGKGCHAIFDGQMHHAVLERLEQGTALRQALARQEFCLHYQPIISLQSGRVCGLEALIRWQHPERGLLGPGAFIELADRMRLLAPLGEWVLHSACQQLHDWQARNWVTSEITVGVNIAGVQLERGTLVKQVQQALSAAHLDPHCLQVEILETAIIANLDTATSTLEELRRAGVKTAIDDFGTGYSSLTRLQQFPLDTLKIDKSFIGSLTEIPENIELVRTILTLARNLGLTSVAEGVETNAQLNVLKELGCDRVQGYLFAKPMAAETCGQWLAGVCSSLAAIPSAQST